MKNIALLILCAFLACGCAGNGFSKFYSGQTREQVLAYPRYIAEDDIKLSRISVESVVADPDATINKMFENGYAQIGYAEWEGPVDEGDAEAKAQAKKVGASYVLWGANYLRTDSGVMPVTRYNPGDTTTTYHAGTVLSPAGSGQYYGTSTTYNPGTVSTDYVPYSVNKYNYLGIFFIKIKPGKLGVKLDDPGDEYKKKFDSNSGAKVSAVMHNGRGAKANIMRGDIIMSVNGTPYDPAHDTSWRVGEDNVLQIYRDGKIITKNIFLDDGNSVKSN